MHGTSPAYHVRFLTGPSFATVETVAVSVRPASAWRIFERKIEAWQGETVRLRFDTISGRLGLDDIGLRTEVPQWKIGNGAPDPEWRADGPHGGYLLFGGETILSEPTSFRRDLTWAKKLIDSSTINSCVEVKALNADDGSTIGTYQAQGPTCQQAATDWLIAHGRLSNNSVDQWHGGLMILDVLAVDAAFDLLLGGSGSSADAPVAEAGDPVNTSTGALTHRHTDLLIPGPGPPLEFARFYNAQAGSEGPLGYNWSHNYNIHLTTLDSGAVVRYGEGHSSRFTESGGSFTASPGNHDVLVENMDGTFTLTTPDQTAFNFDAGGVLTSIADRNSNATTLTYSMDGQLETVTDEGGRELSFEYDPLIGGVTAPLGQGVAAFTNSDFQEEDYTNWTTTGTAFGSAPFDGSETFYGRSLTAGVGATGTLTSTTFTAGHTLRARLGGTSNEPGNVYLAVVLADTSEVLETSPANDADTLEDVFIDTSAYAGQTIQVRAVDDSASGFIVVDEIEVSYESRLRSVEDPLGRTVEFDYDAAGDLVEVTDVKGGVTSYTYTDAHQMATLTDANDHLQTESYYDAQGRVWKQVDAVDGVFCFFYGWGPLTSDGDCPPLAAGSGGHSWSTRGDTRRRTGSTTSCARCRSRMRWPGSRSSSTTRTTTWSACSTRAETGGPMSTGRRGW
ncbi:MAG: hypothetical protein GEU28_06665 [Dehalococcoidia bacterium]|nr:hypothetical protein [Dehalococcoidia bacterium]